VGSTNGEIYVDGNLVKTGLSSSGTANSTSKLFMGRVTFFNRYFNGNISNVKIYNRALTSEEVKQNYNALKSRYI
jgi:hypothetical protein